MRRRIAIIALVLGCSVGLFQLRTSAQQPNMEQQRARQEIAVMKSILQTTLDFAAREENRPGQARTGRSFGFSQITGLYLRGQGAVFTIPVSARGRFGDYDFDFNFTGITTGEGGEVTVTVPTPVPTPVPMVYGDASSEEELQRAQEELERAQQDLEKQQGKAAEAKAKAQERLQRNMEQLRKNQERMKQRQQDLEKRRAELAQRIERLKVYLRDVLATHGDSLGIVKAQEFVTLVITSNGPHGWYAESGADEPTQNVLSVKKSDVVDLKSGRITREQFDQRVMDYQY
jgi:DNA repair exonuclease SbcCD ATPase subunit